MNDLHTTKAEVGEETFGPAISKDDSYRLEEKAQEAGQGRRIVLMTLIMDAPHLAQFSIDRPDVYAETYEAIQAFVAHSGAVHEFARKAAARMALADCGPTWGSSMQDALELLDDLKAEGGES